MPLSIFMTIIIMCAMPHDTLQLFVVYCTYCMHIIPSMQAVKKFYNAALQKREFPVMIDRSSSAVELMIPSDSTWDVIPDIKPPKVHNRH